MAEDRVKVGCINWSHPDAPHAVSFVLRDGEAIAMAFHASWPDALERANRLAVKLRAARHATANSSHATMCGSYDAAGSGCFVPWCSCGCHRKPTDSETGADRG